MVGLSSEQNQFLNHHQICPSTVFDATGLGPKDYGKIMSDLGCRVAIGVTPCRKVGHTMRLKSGTCVQCHPAGLGFQDRFNAHAYVYVCGSLQLEVLKVGVATDVNARMDGLNMHGYGGAIDWQCFYWIELDNAGEIEFEVHSILSPYATPTSYLRAGKKVDCLEVFSCSASSAIDALESLLDGEPNYWKDSKNLCLFEFADREGAGFVRSGRHQQGFRATPLYRSKATRNPKKKGITVNSEKRKQGYFRGQWKKHVFQYFFSQR